MCARLSACVAISFLICYVLGIMKSDIHPTYNSGITVSCACGNSFEVGSTEKAISVEVCSACHPFYTGKSKIIDTAGRVEKFAERLEEAQKAASAHTQAAKHSKRSKKKAQKEKTDNTVQLN